MAYSVSKTKPHPTPTGQSSPQQRCPQSQIDDLVQEARGHQLLALYSLWGGDSRRGDGEKSPIRAFERKYNLMTKRLPAKPDQMYLHEVQAALLAQLAPESRATLGPILKDYGSGNATLEQTGNAMRTAIARLLNGGAHEDDSSSTTQSNPSAPAVPVTSKEPTLAKWTRRPKDTMPVKMIKEEKPTFAPLATFAGEVKTA